MIHVDFAEPNTPAWKRWRADVTKAVNKLVEDVAASRGILITGALYKRRKREIFDAFSNKCAYCESDLGSQHGDVEHYRPKKGVTDLEDSPALCQVGGQAQPHPGYYWVAYDWRNLLPSCAKCNQQPTVRDDGTLAGKGNRFPIEGSYAYDPADPVHTDLSREDPLLLHPCLDDPADHLFFLPDTGALGWHTVRGEKTIDVLDLNREWLRDKRRETYQAVVSLFAMAALAALQNNVSLAKDLKKQLDEYEAGGKPYSLAGRSGLTSARDRVTGI